MPNKRDSFCIMPFIHLHNMSNGLLKMCCLVERPITDDFGKQFFIGNQDIEEVWNSNFLKTARKLMIEGEEVPICNHCYNEEDAGGKSLRQVYNEQYLENNQAHVEDAKANNYSLTKFPTFVELRTGSSCNSACRMCNTNDSSLVYKETTEIHNTLKTKFKEFSDSERKNGYDMLGNPEKIIFGNVEGLHLSTIKMDLDKHIDDIIDNIKDINTITLSGGEPFVLEKTIHLLEVIADQNPDLRLNINTNGSITSKKMITALKKLKDVHVCVSMEGIEKVQEYIRYPLKWNKIDKNLNLFKSIASENLFLSFNVTVQMLNILNLKELCLFVNRNFPWCSLNLSILKNPIFFNIVNLPDEVKEVATKSNIETMEILNQSKSQDFHQENNKQKMIASLQTINSVVKSTTYDETKFQMFKDNVKIYDHYREQNIVDYIPDWAPYL